MKKLVLCIAVAIFAMATAVQAYPTLVGPTGAGVLPTAGVTPASQINIAGDYWDTDNLLVLGAENTFPIRVLFGITPGAEVGGLYAIHEVGETNADTWGVNAKFTLPFTIIPGSAMSIGGVYTRTQEEAFPFATDTVTVTQAYLVGDYTLLGRDGDNLVLTGSLGVNWTDIDVGFASDDAFRVFAAASLGFRPGLTLVADVQTTDTDLGDIDPLYSVALRYDAARSIGLQAGYTNAIANGFLGGNTGRFFAGVNISFGGDAPVTDSTTADVARTDRMQRTGPGAAY